MTNNKKVLVSGVKPTGKPHVGNYFGAMRQFASLQEDYEARIFIADLHALTKIQNKNELEENSISIILDYLAIGLDPEKVLIYKQSDMPQVTELSWIFSCITSVPYLMRAHAFKDAEAKNKDINAGTFTYPILMAADILIHDAEIVPVGLDQQQHIEIARDVASKFNRIFGETFVLPQAEILKETGTVPGIDGQKMSKSYNNTIPLFASDSEIEKAVMSIPTDSKAVNEPKDAESSILFAIHKLFLDNNEVEKLRAVYTEGGVGYKDLKESLISDIKSRIAPFREKRDELEKNKDIVHDMLRISGERAREIAEIKMQDVRQKIGLVI